MEPDHNASPPSPQPVDNPILSAEQIPVDSQGNLEDKRQSPLLTPVHWLHHRRESYASIAEERPDAITLEDHTEGTLADDDAVWAKTIYIEDYSIISGNIPSVGSFVVWHCRIDTLDGGSFIIRRRYSEFWELRRKLLMTFPKSEGAMPPFPRKTLIREFFLL